MAASMVFKQPLGARSDLRQAIDRHYRADETECIEALLGQLDLAIEEEMKGLEKAGQSNVNRILGILPDPNDSGGGNDRD